MKAIDIAKQYFDLSNQSDFEDIAKLLTENTVYHSQNTGEYIGAQAILTMQRAFHASFKTLRWEINSVQELEPGVIVFDYDFAGETTEGQVVRSSGLESITVEGGKITRIEISKRQ